MNFDYLLLFIMVDLSCLLRKDEIYGARLLKEYVEIYSSDDPFEIKLGLNYSDEIHKLLSNIKYLNRLVINSNKYNKYLSSMLIETYKIVDLSIEELLLSASLPMRVSYLECVIYASEYTMDERYDIVKMLPQVSTANKFTLEFYHYPLAGNLLNFALEKGWKFDNKYPERLEFES